MKARKLNKQFNQRQLEEELDESSHLIRLSDRGHCERRTDSKGNPICLYPENQCPYEDKSNQVVIGNKVHYRCGYRWGGILNE